MNSEYTANCGYSEIQKFRYFKELTIAQMAGGLKMWFVSINKIESTDTKIPCTLRDLFL